jgi:hypothetical protein
MFPMNITSHIIMWVLGLVDLSYAEINKLSIPNNWKQWMFAKAMNVDAKSPSESFGKVFTAYLHSLPSSTDTIGGTVMDQAWS